MTDTPKSDAVPDGNVSPVSDRLPMIEHAGFLEDLVEVPPFLLPDHGHAPPLHSHFSCAFCGVGNSGRLITRDGVSRPATVEPAEGDGIFKVNRFGQPAAFPARLAPNGRLEVQTSVPLTPPEGVVNGKLVISESERPVVAREIARQVGADGVYVSQTFALFRSTASTFSTIIRDTEPTRGCVKLKISMGQQRPVFPIHLAPSVFDSPTGQRRPTSYKEAIARLADLLLTHRAPGARTLIYACGQVDYFTIFSFQEVFRLLGIRNIGGNAEHCLNAGAVHNELLTGQEGPFLTIAQALEGSGHFFLLNGWNGLITHPPVFHQLLKRADLDAYLIDVMVTESAQMLARKLGPEHVLFVRPGSDPHLALAVAHEILTKYPQTVDERFVKHYADQPSFEQYVALARSQAFAPEKVAGRIAPEPSYAERLLRGMQEIASKLVQPDIVPINIPSVGLSQTKGVVAHCLWGSLLAMLGKYGLRADGTPAGGTLRVPGQINAQSEIQGLSRNCFMGRIRVAEGGAREAARRMGLPDDGYDQVLRAVPTAVLDYSDPVAAGERELILCFGTQFESNMMERARWVRKLADPQITLVVVDPIPDPFTLKTAALVIPAPPHTAAAKVYQNGEWRLTLSMPRKRAPQETRTDPTIVYDAMAEISRRLREDATLRAAHPDLARHVESGYLRKRFEPLEWGGGLPRIAGEVSRPYLWERVLAYMAGGEGRAGPLYCRPEHPEGHPIAWEELLASGTIMYGGVGITRYRLDYDDPDHHPFGDIFRRPEKFTFFVPTEQDLVLPEGIILNSGRSTLSDDKARVRFAVATFNSGKATPAVDMPDENPLCISPLLAERFDLRTGDYARVTNVETGEALVLPVEVTDRVKGASVYVSFHKCRAELKQGRYVNTVTSHTGRCPYSGQTNLKSTRVSIEPVEAPTPSGSAGVLAKAYPQESDA